MKPTPIIGQRCCATIASGQSKGKSMIGILESYDPQQGKAILSNEQGWMSCVTYSTLTQELTDEKLMQLLSGTNVILKVPIKALKIIFFQNPISRRINKAVHKLA